jgi:hypothetical protein
LSPKEITGLEYPADRAFSTFLPKVGVGLVAGSTAKTAVLMTRKHVEKRRTIRGHRWNQ